MRALLFTLLLATLSFAQTDGVSGGTPCSNRDQKTVGTCMILDCWDSRGPTDCRDSECWCQDGYYTADDETCIACPQDCAGPAGFDGAKNRRTMYQSASVNAPDQCVSESQCQDCNDGTWTGWSGSGFQYSSCTVMAQCEGMNGYLTNGGSESRVMYQYSSVNALDECVSQTQTRTCNDGIFSSWSGTFSEESCDVKDMCEDVRNGETSSRVRYQSTDVNAPAVCVPETQIRTCNDGIFTDWEGVGYVHKDCVVRAQCQNPLTTNGESQSRVRYEAAEVNAPDQCMEETQTRDCSDGTWGGWSGTFTEESCVVRAQCQNPEARSGETQDRTMFSDNSVRAPDTCNSETQTRTCYDGVWGSYDGTFTFDDCYQFAQCADPVARHDESDSRVKYRESEVALPEKCDSEKQARYCQDGAWTDFAPLTFTMDSCKELAMCADPEVSSGNDDNRARFESASVNAPDECQEEVQTRTCHDGQWSGFHPTNYDQTDCTVMKQCENPLTVNSGTDARTMFKDSSVNLPDTCQSEVQTRTCQDGVFTGFAGAGNYQESGCVERAMCDSTSNGDSETRTRYKEMSVPDGETCQSETQSRVCNDGTFADWSPNNYKRDECSVNTCSMDELNVEIKIKTGDCGESVSWSIGNSCSGSGYDKDDTYKKHCCFTAGDHTLACNDNGQGWQGGKLYVNDQEVCSGSESKTVHIGTCDQRGDSLQYECDSWYEWCWMSQWQSTCVNGMCECVDDYFSTDQQTCQSCPEDSNTLMVLDGETTVSPSYVRTFLAAVGAAALAYLFFKLVKRSCGSKQNTSLQVSQKKTRSNYNSVETEEI